MPTLLQCMKRARVLVSLIAACLSNVTLLVDFTETAEKGVCILTMLYNGMCAHLLSTWGSRGVGLGCRGIQATSICPARPSGTSWSDALVCLLIKDIHKNNISEFLDHALTILGTSYGNHLIAQTCGSWSATAAKRNCFTTATQQYVVLLVTVI